MKVMLIDDEPVALRAMQNRIDWVRYGFTEVLTAGNALDARALLEKTPVDMVLCDVEMPGENGLSLLSYIKNILPDSECIMVTCHAEFDYVRTALRCGASDYILKPIDYTELIVRLEEFACNRDKLKCKMEQHSLFSENAQQEAQREIKYSERINIVVNYMSEHLHEKVYMEELANLVYVNEQYLMRSFKKETGQSLTNFMAHLRICKAGELLRNTDYNINFIADTIGCGSFSYFTKFFRRYTGQTPSEYRKNFGNN